MKQSIRFFAFGLITASILLFGTYFLSNTSQTVDMSKDDMIEALEEYGYRTISETDYVAFSFFKEQEMQNDDEAEKDKPKKDDKEKDKDKQEDGEASKDEDDEKENDDEVDSNDNSDNEDEDVITHTFTTTDGVVSQNIADILVEEKIIDDRREFLDYLDDNGYSARIQLGKFTVSSDMSYKEIAEIITTYPGS